MINFFTFLIGESQSKSSFTILSFERGKVFCGMLGLCVLWGFWEEKNFRIFRELERSLNDVLFLIRFSIYLWTSVAKSLCNYLLGSCSSCFTWLEVLVFFKTQRTLKVQ